MRFISKRVSRHNPSEIVVGTGTRVNSDVGTSHGSVKSVTSSESDASVVSFSVADLKATRQSDGSVILDFSCHVDVIEAVRSDLTKVTVTFSRGEPDLSGISDGFSSEPGRILDGIVNSYSRLRKSARDRRDRLVKSVDVDITSVIDNSVARYLRRGASPVDTNRTVRSEKTISTVTVKDLVSPVPNLQILTAVSTTGRNQRGSSTRQIMIDMLLKDGGSIFTSYPAMPSHITAEKSLSGTAQLPSRRGNTRGSVTSSDIRARKLAALVTPQSVNVNSSDDVRGGSETSKSTSIVRLSSRPRRIAKVRSKIRLSRRDLESLGNNFNISVKVNDKSGQTKASSGCCVDLVVLSEEPEIITQDKPDKDDPVKDESDGKDDKGDEDEPPDDGGGGGGGGGGGNTPKGGIGPVDISVDDYSQFDPIDSVWDYSVGGSSTSGGGSTSTGNSSHYGGGVIVMRMSPNSRKNSEQREMSERVSRSRSRNLATASPYARTPAEVDNRFVSVSAFLRQGGVTIRLGGFQSSYVVEVVRRDHTVGEKKFSSVNSGRTSTPVTDTSQDVFFLDEEVKVDHTYEYKAKIYTREGRSILGTGSSYITYRRLEENVAVLRTSDPEVSVRSKGRMDVRFSVTSDFSDSNVSAMVTSLKKQGLDIYFTDDIETNRNRLKKITTYLVERVDLTRGVSESFGFFNGTVFSDVDAQRSANVSPLSPDRDYRYVITLFARDAESLIPTITRTYTDTTTGNSYSVQPAKYFHPTTLRTGTVRSESTVSLSDYTSEFLAGFVGVQVFVDVSTKTARPKIVGGSVTGEKSSNVVTWKVVGQARKVSHFILVSERLGSFSVVGRVHPFSSNNSYRFVDVLSTRQAGDVTYHVRIVYSDLTLGELIEVGTVLDSDLRQKRV